MNFKCRTFKKDKKARCKKVKMKSLQGTEKGGVLKYWNSQNENAFLAKFYNKLNLTKKIVFTFFRTFKP